VMAEAIFLGLRLSDGIDFAAFARQYGVSPAKRFRRQIARLAELGLLSVDAAGMRLTRRGLLLGNEVFAEFI
jgi:oxygen-independent coproporphyrinogen-3 oxidase